MYIEGELHVGSIELEHLNYLNVLFCEKCWKVTKVAYKKYIDKLESINLVIGSVFCYHLLFSRGGKVVSAHYATLSCLKLWNVGIEEVRRVYSKECRNRTQVQKR